VEDNEMARLKMEWKLKRKCKARQVKVKRFMPEDLDWKAKTRGALSFIAKPPFNALHRLFE